MADQATGVSGFAHIESPILSIAISPAFDTDHTCYAGGPAGLYRSDNAGRLWQAVALPAPNIPVLALILSPTYPSDRTLFCGSQGGVLRSGDAGQTWEVSLMPPPEPTVTALAVSPGFAQDGTLFAATDGDGVFRSGDRGSSWNSWNFGLLDLHVLCLAISPNFVADQTLFAGTSSGLFKSRNGGRSWAEVAFPTDAAPVLSLAISPQFGDDGTLYVGTEASRLFVSNDHAQHWSPSGDSTLRGAMNVITLAHAFPAEPTLMIATSEAIYSSPDRGETWVARAAIADVFALAAPYGMANHSPVLIGRAEGGIHWLAQG